jgi:F-type H+-transporting ATPase subunit b
VRDRKLKKINSIIFLMSILFISTYTDAIAAEDLLKIDKILIFQIVIFVAAIFILNSLLFKPLFQLVDRREELTTGAIKEANKLRQRIDQIINEYNAKLDEARSQALEERKKIRHDAHKAAEEILEKARDQAQTLLNLSKDRLESEKIEKEKGIEPEIKSLARIVASRILEKEL